MKKLILSIMIFVLVLLTACSSENETRDEYELYNDAVLDAMVAEESELQDLVVLDVEDKMTTWNDDEVLLITWNKYPESYIEGEKVQLKYGSIWTFTDKEILAWYDETEGEISDYNLRFKQLIGLPPEDDNTHFTGMWVNPEDVIRPAYYTNANADTMDISNVDMGDLYKEWFDDNIITSYYSEYKYPWTRLGYTYDWSGDGNEYGLTEFLIKENSEVTVEFTMTTEEFISYMKNELTK